MERLCDSIINTADCLDQIEVVFYIDVDDIQSQYKANILADKLNIAVLIDDRISQGEMTNELAKIATGSILHMCGDDLIFRDKSWDTQVSNIFSKYQDGIVLVYTNDGINGERFGTHPFVHKNWVKALGRVCFGFRHGYCDNWVTDLARGVQRIKYLPILIEHMHHSFGKGEFDETSKDLKAALDKYRPDLLYLQTNELRQKDIRKLQDFIDNFNRN
jgi:hypothetical protein